MKPAAHANGNVKLVHFERELGVEWERYMKELY